MFISADFWQPDRDQWKTWMTLGALLLALANVGLMRIIWKQHFGWREATYRRLARVHRAFGYGAFGIMLFIAIVTCIGIIGFGGYGARPTWHSYLGITVLGMMGIKIIAVRKGLPEGGRFRAWGLAVAAAATVALAIAAWLVGSSGSAVMPLFPLAVLLGFLAWRRFGPLPVVGTGMALSIGLLFASSGGWWFAQQASRGGLPDVSAAMELEGDIELGRTVYRQSGCAACHGPQGFGGVGPSLRDARFAYRHTAETIAQRVRAGKGVMPPFGSDRITDQELAALVRFIRNWYSPE